LGCDVVRNQSFRGPHCPRLHPDEEETKKAVISLLGRYMRVCPKVSGLAAWMRTADGTALCHQVQLYRYFVSRLQSFVSITLCVASHRKFIVLVFVVSLSTQSGDFLIHLHTFVGMVFTLTNSKEQSPS
jgi:hypothetical protein